MHYYIGSTLNSPSHSVAYHWFRRLKKIKPNNNVHLPKANNLGQ